MIGIYKITSPKGKIYIGQSINIERRFKYYIYLVCKRQKKLYNSFLKYDVKNHIFEVIEECSVELLNERERYYQEFYNVLSKNGLNCQLVKTNDKKYVHSKETKMKISKSNTGKVGRKGVKFTDEHKEKISKSKIGIKRPDVSIRFTNLNKSMIGIKNSFYGKRHTEETKKILSEKNKNKNVGLKNQKSKIILDINTGVYYYSILELSKLLNVNNVTLYKKLSGIRFNNTNYIIV